MADFRINDQGTIVLFTPISDAAREWVDENVASDSWQWFGPQLCVDHRMAGDLLDGIVAAGFEIEA
jgi:hypothetical protein